MYLEVSESNSHKNVDEDIFHADADSNNGDYFIDEDVYLFCEEFGADGESWYSCVQCFLWTRVGCSDSNFPNGYMFLNFSRSRGEMRGGCTKHNSPCKMR
jgi:hypothetical protein